MSLYLIITNDGTGPDDASNYNWRVQVNELVVAEGRVEGHDRNQPWQRLVEKVVGAADRRWAGVLARLTEETTP